MDQFYTSYVFILITVIFSIKGFNDRLFTEKYMFIPYLVKHDREWYRILSHSLLHADFIHLIFNMFALYGFGRFVEQIYIDGSPYDLFDEGFGKQAGTFYFVALYILGGLFATVIPYLRHKDNPSYRSLGASGAVSAVVFASVMLAPTSEVIIYVIPVPAFIFGPLYLAFEIYSDRHRKGNIAHDAHIGGAIFGIIFVLITNINAVKASFNALF